MKKLSVIIPTVNRAKLLKQTLESIALQTMPKSDFEIIVIDNGSTDCTKEICENYQSEHGNLKYIYDARPGLHIGRNRGCLESQTDILVYADDDIIAGKKWLQTIYDGFKEEKVVLIGGNNYPYFEKRQPKWVKDLWTYDYKEKLKRLECYSVIIIGNKKRRVEPGAIFGCNFAIRKKIVLKAKGFHPDGVPDKFLKYRGDGESYITQYIKQNNLKAMFYPEASIYHMITEQRLNKEYVKKIAFRTGISHGYSVLRECDSVKNYINIWKIAIAKILMTFIKREKKEINNIYKYNLCLGYMYILCCFGIDIRVKKWIKKIDYFDAVIPEYNTN